MCIPNSKPQIHALKYITLGLLITILCLSCIKNDQGNPLVVSALDVDTGAPVERGTITFRVELPDDSGLLGWGPSPSRIDTIAYKLGQIIYDNDLLGEKDCRSDISFYTEGYHSEYQYYYFCKSFNLDTIHFQLRQKVDVQVRIKSADTIRCAEVLSLSQLQDLENPRINQRRVDDFDFDGNHNLFFTDTSFQLQLIKNDSSHIRVNYWLKDDYRTYTIEEKVKPILGETIEIRIGG